MGSNPLFGRLRSSGSTMAGLYIFAAVILFAFLVPLFVSGDPNQINILKRNIYPSLAFPLGTDMFGRDMMLRIAHGSKMSLSIAFGITVIAVFIGTLVGMVAGYAGGWIDTLTGRIIDALMSFPSILLALAVMAMLGSSVQNIIIALSLVYIPRVSRVARAATISERSLEYVEAARSCGGSPARVLFRHILPNITSPIIVQGTIVFAYALIAEAALDFLGIGMPPPDATWGNLLSEGRRTIMSFPYQTLFPALVFGVTVLGVNLLGDGLRDVFDPQMRGVGRNDG
jgi:peptide/nickel transport system permease protein